MAQADTATGHAHGAGAGTAATATDRYAPPTVLRAWDGDVAITDIPGAAALTGVSRRTIYNWIADGKIEYRRLPSGKLRIVITSLWRAGIATVPARSAPAGAPE